MIELLDKGVKRLKAMRIWSVALVDRGANPESRVVIAKAADAPAAGADDDDDDAKKAVGATSGKDGPRVGAGSGAAAQPGATRAQVGAKPPGLVSSVDSGTASSATPTGAGSGKGSGTVGATSKGETNMAEIADIQKQLDETKALNTTLAERIEKAEKAEQAARERVEKLESARRREQYIAKVERELKDLPGASADDFAPILEAAEKGMAPEQIEKLWQVLKSAAAVSKQSKVFTEFGRVGDGNYRKSSTMEAIAKLAGFTKSGKLLKPEEVEKALKLNEEAYEREYGNPPPLHATGTETGSGYPGRA